MLLRKTALIGAAFMLMIGVASCVKKDFDAPPDNTTYDPNLSVTTTIAQLIAMPQGQAITEDLTISGVVVMDDKSGNFYKTIIIQDSTAGIQILLDQNSLYNDYPVGRKVYVKLKGLYLGNYGETMQLGYTPDATGGITNIPGTLIGDYIVKANYPNTIAVDTLSVADLMSPNAAAQYLNKLIAIRDVEFDATILGSTYAQASQFASATNRKLVGCDGSSITLRTSGYAKFQPAIIPGGNGVIVGIYTRYGNTPQVYIRDTNDVKLNGVRCDGSSPSTQVLFSDGFENLSKWNPVSVVGTQVWHTESFGNPAPCAVMKGYEGGNNANEDWLISQAINIPNTLNSAILTFETAGKYNGAMLEAYISTNYSGSGEPSAATWSLLNAQFDQSGNFTFTNSGDIDLISYKGQNVYIAFKYVSTTSDGKTWEVDNVRIVGE